MTSIDKNLLDDLSKIILDKLKAMESEKDARKEFRNKVLKLWFPAIAAEFASDEFDRAEKVTELIEDRDHYYAVSSESAFEKIYADSVSVWYWSKKAKDGYELNPKVEKFVRSQVKFLVGVLGEKETADV